MIYEPDEKLSPKMKQIIRRMLQSNDSQQIAVADCLNTIASNGEGQETDSFLCTCAFEIVRAAQSVMIPFSVSHTPPAVPEPRLPGLKVYTAFCQQHSGEGTTWIEDIYAPDLEAAKVEAVIQCAHQWGWDTEEEIASIHLLGISEGSAAMVFWKDHCDVDT